MRGAVLSILGLLAPLATPALAEQDMVCEGVLSSEFTGTRWWVRIGECDLLPDALDKDRIAILKGCNPKQKFFALCRVFARIRESDDAIYGNEIVHVYLVRAITGQEWEKKTELAKDERAAIKRGFRKEHRHDPARETN